MKHRVERINSLIQEELAKIFLREMEFPAALVTISRVETSDDMARAAVGLSVIPSGKSEEVLKLVNGNRELPMILAKNMAIKPMPKIVFEIDPHT
ncbi:ribosome-binding factor A [Candidatus Wolfebacteria bacterium]|nr:ribosome-binding factor A [Candidatus Wolfebacteria bacterium]